MQTVVLDCVKFIRRCVQKLLKSVPVQLNMDSGINYRLMFITVFRQTGDGINARLIRSFFICSKCNNMNSQQCCGYIGLQCDIAFPWLWHLLLAYKVWDSEIEEAHACSGSSTGDVRWRRERTYRNCRRTPNSVQCPCFTFGMNCLNYFLVSTINVGQISTA